MDQKGMEIAINTFIILFVALVVALLVIQLVTQYVNPPLKNCEEKLLEAKRVAETKCMTLCNTARASPSMKTIADFCKETIGGDNKGLDLTKDCVISGYDEGFLIGTGICEDTIYCSQLIECNIGGSPLTMARCTEALCNFWQSQGLSAEAKNSELSNFIKPGNCYSALADKSKHWYTRLFDKNKDGLVAKEEITCG
ncbi:MAG: hypothetical protein N3F05_01895 [Candidatus Diapherotrites archaeon]|nr:hypothetical protein [Candidatus Diapherotrites archaeon]